MTDLRTAPRAGFGAALAVPEFRSLAGAALISVLGDSAAYLATTVLVYQRTGSSLLASLTFVAAFAPYLVGGTLLSGLVDRLPPRRLLVGCDLVGAALVAVAALPFVPVPGVFVVLLLLGVMAPVRSGTAAALVAEVLPGDSYVAGRSVVRITSQLAQVLGAGAGGAVIAPLGARGALAADALTFLVSAALLLIGVRVRPARAAAATKNLLADSLVGVRDVLARPVVRRWVLLAWAVPFVAVWPEAIAPPAVEAAGRTDGWVGLWLAAIPVGIIVGDVLAVSFLPPRTRRATMWPLALMLGLVMLGFALTPPFPVQIALLVATGLTAAYALPLDQLLRDDSPPALLARVLTVQNTGLMVVQGLGFAAAGAVAEFVTPTTTIALGGGLGVVFVLALLLSGRRPR